MVGCIGWGHVLPPDPRCAILLPKSIAPARSAAALCGRIIGALGLSLGLSLSLSGCSRACLTAQPPPDVYVIVVDSLRADHLGLGGYVSPTSPDLDAWASDAVVFDRAYTTAPWTLPSLSAVVTGHHPYVVGVREEQTSVPDSVTTMGEIFHDAGYQTAAVVSHIYLLPKYGLMQGMDSVNIDLAIGSHKSVTGDGVTDRALDVIADRQQAAAGSDKPLFMLVHYFDPHYNYIGHPDLYDSNPDYRGPIHSGMGVGLLRRVLKGQKDPQLADSLRQVSNLYDSEIRSTDHSLARLLAGIQASGRGDNSLIVVLGDHGEELGQRDTRWVGHTKVVSEDVLHVPLVMRLPGHKQPRKRVGEPVSLVDLLPTIAAQAGVALPKDLSLWGRPIDLKDASAQRSVLFAETGRWARMQVVLKGRWKMVEYPKLPPGTRVLYDLSQDSGETRDVSAEQPQVLSQLQADLATWNTAIEADHRLISADATVPGLSADEVEALRAMGYME